MQSRLFSICILRRQGSRKSHVCLRLVHVILVEVPLRYQQKRDDSLYRTHQWMTRKRVLPQEYFARSQK